MRKSRTTRDSNKSPRNLKSRRIFFGEARSTEVATDGSQKCLLDALRSLVRERICGAKGS